MPAFDCHVCAASRDNDLPPLPPRFQHHRHSALARAEVNRAISRWAITESDILRAGGYLVEDYQTSSNRNIRNR